MEGRFPPGRFFAREFGREARAPMFRPAGNLSTGLGTTGTSGPVLPSIQAEMSMFDMLFFCLGFDSLSGN